MGNGIPQIIEEDLRRLAGNRQSVKKHIRKKTATIFNLNEEVLMNNQVWLK